MGQIWSSLVYVYECGRGSSFSHNCFFLGWLRVICAHVRAGQLGGGKPRPHAINSVVTPGWPLWIQWLLWIGSNISEVRVSPRQPLQCAPDLRDSKKRKLWNVVWAFPFHVRCDESPSVKCQIIKKKLKVVTNCAHIEIIVSQDSLSSWIPVERQILSLLAKICKSK